MPRRAISLFAVVVLSVLAPGCWLVHGRGEPVARDAAVGRDGGLLPPGARDGSVSMLDGFVIPDAASIDPPLRCEVTRPDVSCLASSYLQPGLAFELPFAFDQCGCCIETECAVRVDAATQTLSLTTTLCPDPCDCDACVTPTGVCSIPGLDVGTWRVVVNDFPAFELPILGTRPTGAPPICASYAEIDRCEPAFPFSGMPVPVGEVCVAPRPSSSTLDVLRVHESCSVCQLLAGPCYAVLRPRLTDDLPPGGDIHLDASEYGTSCDIDCPGVCVPRDRDCVVPALVPGDFYRVFVGDAQLTTFVAGEPSVACPD